jgi:hypothetical protein
VAEAGMMVMNNWALDQRIIGGVVKLSRLNSSAQTPGQELGIKKEMRDLL